MGGRREQGGKIEIPNRQRGDVELDGGKKLICTGQQKNSSGTSEKNSETSTFTIPKLSGKREMERSSGINEKDRRNSGKETYRERNNSGNGNVKPNLVTRKASRDRSVPSSSRDSFHEKRVSKTSSADGSVRGLGEIKNSGNSRSGLKKESSKSKNERKRKRKKEKKLIQTEGIFS